jgi:predicted RNA binding protein YcfA (HicA-like mRNA interferase family)
LHRLVSSVSVGFGKRLRGQTSSVEINASILRATSWRQVAQNGSHVQFKHDTIPGRVTAPHPTRDLPLGTLRNIEKQAGIKLR